MSLENLILNRDLRVVLLTTLLAQSHLVAADYNDLVRLKSDLKSGYDPHTRPTQRSADATLLNIDLYLRGFEFDEKKSVFTLYALASLEWTDFHMKWDPRSYGNIQSFFFAAHEVWQPDIAVYNNYDSTFDAFHNTRVAAQYTGELLWLPLATIRVGCSANLRKWPYDQHTCKIEMGSWSHTAEKLRIVLPSSNVTSLDTHEWVENREWRLVSNTIQLVETLYNFSNSNQTMTQQEIILTMNIQRRSSTHTAAIVIQAFVIGMAIIISFWLRPGASERLALILVVLFINSMFLYNVYLLIPNNGNNIPLVVLYYRDSLLMVSIALIWTVALRFLAATERTSPVPLPNWIQIFLDGWISQALCLDPRPRTSPDNNIQSDQEIGVDDTVKLVSNGSYQKDWAWLAHLLDRLAFLIYFIVYIILTIALL